MSTLEDPSGSRRLLEAAQTLGNDAVAAELIAALEDAGVRSILLKGPAIARWLYNEEERRNYRDVDLLVAPAELPSAARIAARIGFRRLGPGRKQIEREPHHERWCRPRDNAVVELHQGFPGVEASHEELWNELARCSEPLVLAGVVARVPGTAARALLVALHAAAHGPAGTPLEDLVRAVAKVPDATWDEAAQLAKRVSAQAAFAVGLSILPEGGRLPTRLGLAQKPAPETILRASLPPPTAMGLERLSRAPGLLPKLRYLASELIPSPEILLRTDPLARHGAAGIALAYAARPFRLATQLPRGFLAWRAARRRAHQWPRRPPPAAD